MPPIESESCLTSCTGLVMDGLLVSMLVLLFISLFVWTNHLILFVQNLVRITWCQDKTFLVIASTLGPQGARSTREHWQPPSKCQTVAGTVYVNKCTMERRLSDIFPLDSMLCSSQCIEVQCSEQSSDCINVWKFCVINLNTWENFLLFLFVTLRPISALLA